MRLFYVNFSNFISLKSKKLSSKIKNNITVLDFNSNIIFSYYNYLMLSINCYFC